MNGDKSKNQTRFGIEIVRRLRPISYNWNDGGAYDIGFGAEDVEKQQSDIEALRLLARLIHRRAAVCKPRK